MEYPCPYILWFDDVQGCRRELVGGKNARLCDMRLGGIRTPPGFAVTTTAFKRHMDEGGLWPQVEEALSGLGEGDIAEIGHSAALIRELIISRPMPEEIAEEILRAYGSLCQAEASTAAAELPVAVRSSATAEDTEDASFAGQQDSFLWVRGDEEVFKATVKCWASLFSERAIAYRIKMGFPHQRMLISVGIQKMVDARCAGVMFTIEPVKGDGSKITIDANWGFGESIAQGMVSADSFTVCKKGLNIEQRRIGEKALKVVAKESGTTVEEVPADQRAIFCLTDEEVKELARMGMLLEERYGEPQDVEWAIDGNLPFPRNVFILQSRPVTTGIKRSFDRRFKKEAKKSETDHIIDLMLKGFKA